MDTTTLSSMPRIDETQSTSLQLLASDDDSLLQSDVVQTYTAAALASSVVSAASRATTSAAVATNTIRNDNDDNSSSVNQSNINNINNINTTLTSTASSVRHPSRRHHLPPAAALQRARDELEAGRMRLTAHGVTSRARTVYLKYDSDTEILLWQTEAARRRQQSSSEDTSWNRLPLANVLFVDVGKKTMALMRQSAVDEEHCLSLLTAAGSLDLQAPSAAQRDALVSVLASLLDQVHDRDWRLLYEETASTAVMGVPSSSAS